MLTYSNVNNRKWPSIFAHASIFFSVAVTSIAIPILVFFASEDEIARENAKEAINFHLNLWLYGMIISFLSYITAGLLGLILEPIWFICHWCFSIWAVIYCFRNPDQPFYYPFIVRLLPKQK